MRIIDTIKISFLNLFRQKLRTTLTIFSIVIGATLISLVYAIIPGFEKFFNLQFNTLNSPKMIEIFPTEDRPGQQFLGSFGSDPQEYKEGESGGGFDFDFGSFTDADIQSIKEIDGVKNVYESPMPSVEYIKLVEQDKKFQVSFTFYYPTFLLENFDVVSGKMLQEGENGKILIANQYVEAFGYDNPEDLIGEKVYLHVKQQRQADPTMGLSPVPSEQIKPEEKDFELEIIGITEKTILSNIVFVSFDDALEITKFSRNTEDVLNDNDENRSVAWVELESEDLAEEVDQKISDIGFHGNTFYEQQDILDDIFDVLMVVFSSFGIIALAVSSLNIINTLIMAVYERTKEIGVMKAVGATKFNVAILFTIEAAFIGLLGGLIGLSFGFGLAEILNIWGHKTILSAFETLDLSNVTPLLFLAPGISTVVATVAGIYPAIRASRLDPVEALRYE